MAPVPGAEGAALLYARVRGLAQQHGQVPGVRQARGDAGGLPAGAARTRQGTQARKKGGGGVTRARTTIRAADLFCGAGGTSQGLVQACEAAGATVDLVAVNHWERAVETHAANHPGARHYCARIDALDPSQVCPKGLDLLVASPECFPAGTLVLTAGGLSPIESVRVGDLVLTHRNRWRRVVDLGHRVADTVNVVGTGHFGLEVTADHPLWTRARRRAWPVRKRGGEWRWSEPAWTPASEAVGLFWGTPTRAERLPIPPLEGVAFSDAFWWVIGRWLGDGSVQLRPDKGGEVAICCGFHECAELGPRLRAGLPQANWRGRPARTAQLFELNHTELARWLVEHFGRGALGKTVPAWALGMSEAWRAALLNGYLSADGSEEILKMDCATVSRSLAIGVRLLAEGLGHRAALYRYAQHTDTIEGRRVNVHDVHRVKWTKDRLRSFSTELDGTSWQRVRSVRPGRAGIVVYNLSVEEDETYVAEGIVVHNCTHHSRARGGKPKNDQSRASGWDVLRWCEQLRPRAVLLENVIEWQDWGPLNDRGQALVSRKGETFAAFLAGLASLGYRVEWRVLNAADYGDATTRRRLFVQARRGRGAIVWPEPTHAEEPTPMFGGPRWRPAREVIDWSLPSRSVFTRERPLAQNTMRRIAEGLRRYAGPQFAEAFLLHVTHGGRSHGMDAPLPTVTGANRGEIGLVQPYLVHLKGTGTARSLASPVPSLQAGGEHVGLAQPFLLSQDGRGAPRAVSEPSPTIVSKGAVSLVEPFLVAYNGTGGAHPVSQPMPTATTRDRFGLVEPVLLDVMFRMLQPRELAAAMSFPRGYRFAGNRGEVIRQIGNAVAVGIARALCGAALRQALEEAA